MKEIIRIIKVDFEKNHAAYWGNLSRFTNLLIALNFSLFFLSELVTKQGYYYTYYSLVCFAIVQIASFLPMGLISHYLYYFVFVIFEAAGIYFFTASIVYWIATSNV